MVQALATGSCDGVDMCVAAVLEGPAAGEHPFVASLARAGVEVVPVSVAARDYGGERAALTALCARVSPAVVHTHGYRADVLDAPAARALGIPTVATVHGFTGGGWKNRCYQWAQRRALRHFDAVVAVSHPLAEQLAQSGVPRERLHVIQNSRRPSSPSALDRAAARQLLGEGETGPRIGWVGRISDEKGPDVFVESLALVRGRSWVACALGDGPSRNRVAARAATLGIGDRIHWHGSVPDAAALFPAFDLFVLSSRTEGTPMVLLEAMASGVPIVATSVGGVPDVVRETEARLVPPEDPGALAAAIADVLDNDAAAQARARAARARLEQQFGYEQWLARYAALYRDLERPRANGGAT